MEKSTTTTCGGCHFLEAELLPEQGGPWTLLELTSPQPLPPLRQRRLSPEVAIIRQHTTTTTNTNITQDATGWEHSFLTGYIPFVAYRLFTCLASQSLGQGFYDHTTSRNCAEGEHGLPNRPAARHSRGLALSRK